MNRFVIHIKGSPRYQRMVSEMDGQYKGEYKIFEAIVNKENPRLGISESFRTIIKENYNEPLVHIFEDDIKFCSSNSRQVFEEAFERLPENWDIFLGGSYTFSLERNLGNYLKINDFRSLHCVVIRKSAYDLFLSHDFDVHDNIDAWVAYQNPNVYLCNPQSAVQHDGYSYNAKKDQDYSRYLKDKNLLV